MKSLVERCAGVLTAARRATIRDPKNSTPADGESLKHNRVVSRRAGTHGIQIKMYFLDGENRTSLVNMERGKHGGGTEGAVPPLHILAYAATAAHRIDTRLPHTQCGG